MKGAAVKIVTKLLNFEQNTMSHGHRSGDVVDIQRRSKFAQEGHNLWRIISNVINNVLFAPLGPNKYRFI